MQVILIVGYLGVCLCCMMEYSPNPREIVSISIRICLLERGSKEFRDKKRKEANSKSWKHRGLNSGKQEPKVRENMIKIQSEAKQMLSVNRTEISFVSPY